MIYDMGTSRGRHGLIKSDVRNGSAFWLSRQQKQKECFGGRRRQMHIRLHPSVWSGSQATRGRFLSTYIKWIFTLLEQREHRKSEARFLAGNPNSIGSHREPFDDFEKDGSEAI